MSNFPRAGRDTEVVAPSPIAIRLPQVANSTPAVHPSPIVIPDSQGSDSADFMNEIPDEDVFLGVLVSMRHIQSEHLQ